MGERSYVPDTLVVQRAVDLIEIRFGDALTTQSIGTAVRTTAVRLARIFRTETGISVHEYLTRLRLHRATHLLQAGMKVEAVARSVGYRSKKNFYRQFQRRFGRTPETFRRLSLPRPMPASTAHVFYSAQFDGTPCRIGVVPRQTLKGGRVFIATPYVLVDHALQPFAVISNCIEIAAMTAAQAVERAAMFLEQRFGARVVPPTRVLNGGKRRRILRPRP
jgi:AraC-like DNA-binding protein